MFILDVEGMAITFRDKTMVLQGPMANSSELLEVRISPKMLDEMSSAFTVAKLPKTKKGGDQ